MAKIYIYILKTEYSILNKTMWRKMWGYAATRIGRKSKAYVGIFKSLPGINKENVYLNVGGIKRDHSVLLSLSHALSFCFCLIRFSTMTACKAEQFRAVKSSHEIDLKSSSILFHRHLQSQNLARATIFSLACRQSLWIQIAGLISFIHYVSSLKKLFASPCWWALKSFFKEKKQQ